MECHPLVAYLPAGHLLPRPGTGSRCALNTPVVAACNATRADLVDKPVLRHQPLCLRACCSTQAMELERLGGCRKSTGWLRQLCQHSTSLERGIKQACFWCRLCGRHVWGPAGGEQAGRGSGVGAAAPYLARGGQPAQGRLRRPGGPHPATSCSSGPGAEPSLASSCRCELRPRADACDVGLDHAARGSALAARLMHDCNLSLRQAFSPQHVLKQASCCVPARWRSASPGLILVPTQTPLHSRRTQCGSCRRRFCAAWLAT